jgi:hypothetical protein
MGFVTLRRLKARVNNDLVLAAYNAAAAVQAAADEATTAEAAAIDAADNIHFLPTKAREINKYSGTINNIYLRS